MTRKSRILSIIGTLLVAGVTFAAAAGPRGVGGPGHGGRGFHGGPGACAAFDGEGHGPLGRALHRLDLSVEQRHRIEALVDAHRDATEPLRAKLAAGFRDRLDTGLDTTFDEAAVRAGAEEHARVMVELRVARARLHAEVLAVLTAEQRAQLTEMKARHAERFERFGERRGWFDDED
jgi:Spy/CpxP family protein refolding chaperone